MAICGVLFVAQLTAVLVLAEVGEEEADEHSEPTETEPAPDDGARTPTETTATEPTPGGGGRSGRGQGGLPRRRRLHELPHARRRRRDRARRPEPRRGKPPTTWSSSGDERQGGCRRSQDTLSEQQIQDVAAYVSSVAGASRGDAPARLSPLGEVSERPKERDWKSRTC